MSWLVVIKPFLRVTIFGNRLLNVDWIEVNVEGTIQHQNGANWKPLRREESIGLTKPPKFKSTDVTVA